MVKIKNNCHWRCEGIETFGILRYGIRILQIPSSSWLHSNLMSDQIVLGQEVAEKASSWESLESFGRDVWKLCQENWNDFNDKRFEKRIKCWSANSITLSSKIYQIIEDTKVAIPLPTGNLRNLHPEKCSLFPASSPILENAASDRGLSH